MTISCPMIGVIKFRCAVSIIAVLTLFSTTPAQAKLDADHINQELASANKAVGEGHVKDGIEALTKLIRSIDPAEDKDAYWKTSATLIELLSLTENHSLAGQVLNELVATKVPQSQAAYLQWAQYYVGRNLAWLGHRDEGDKLLRVLTGADLRLVHNPAQRAAALMLSKIEGDRRNIAQSAIWMRRAVVGTLVDKAASSGEIVDVLTKYAVYLAMTRRLLEANILFGKLEPIYNNYFNWHGPQYLYFASRYLFNLTSLGSFQTAEVLLKRLNDVTAGVDIPPNSLKAELFFQNFYKTARTKPAAGEPPVGDGLKKVVSDSPHFLEDPQNRIQFSYYALISGDLDLAEKFNSSVVASAPLDDQFAAYEVILRSFIAARRGQFVESIALVRDGLDRIRKFHRLAENESSRRLPALSIEERLILGLILSTNAGHISTFDQASTLFQLQQYLSRDKGALGLNAMAVRQEAKSALQREDIRSRDRLLVLRDKILDEAADALLARVIPIKDYTPGQKNDYGPLTRLEEVEDKISRTEDEQRLDAPLFNAGSDSPVDLEGIQKLIGTEEALVLHALTASGIVTTCITSDRWTFNVKGVDAAKIVELDTDYKQLLKAVHESYAPSAVLDAEFPSESSYRIYDNLFGGIEACLKHTTQIFLATDPDFFTLPWNALLTTPPSKETKFSHRSASWLPKSYSISLLPSVRSLYQLRSNLASSRARRNFLGIGAPDLKGEPERNKEIATASLYLSRGVANRAAIAELDALPETADELRDVAKALGAADSDILLGAKATERAMRSQPLDDYRVISFATHALVAGEIDGIAEPALVLTPGTGDYNDKNDGLLTATEIANLTLDANLVILSACNTAASDGRASGRGLSGLADAFFFAGARSVAVTQWEVGSDEAKQLGSGLVSRSVGSRSGGVAEGLRQTMVSYIAAANQDYLAHPRFWAAFVIAGDGAVHPLDGSRASESDRHDYIRIEQEYVSSNAEDVELLSLAGVGRSIFALGMQKPPAGEKRAGSYLARVKAGAGIEVVQRAPELAPSSLAQIGDDLGVFGFLSAEQGSSAAFRLLDKNGREKWGYVESGKHWNLPISAVRSSTGYIFLSTDVDKSPATTSATLIVTQLSESGRAVMQRRYSLPVAVGAHGPKNVVVEPNGTITVSLPGRLISKPSNQLLSWINPKTGTKTFCVGNPDATVLLSIDKDTLELRNQKILENVRVKTMRQQRDRLYAAIDFSKNCSLDTNVKLVEISPDFELRTIFESRSINSIEATDIEITPDHFVLVGIAHTFLPTSSTRQPFSAEGQQTDLWKDEFWENISEDRLSGFVLIVSPDGTQVSDRVFAGVAHRAISSLFNAGSGSFVAAGETFSARGWIMAFSLGNTEDDLLHRVRLWLKRIGMKFGWAR
jgi:CHAT domain-containing protein